MNNLNNLKDKIKTLLSILGMNLIFFSLRRKFPRAKLMPLFRRHLLESGIASERNQQLNFLMRGVMEAREQIVRGKYFSGTKQIEEIYQEIYNVYGISQSQALSPNLLSIEWSWAFGHLGNAAVYLKLRELDEDFRRHTLLVSSKSRGNELIEIINRHHDVTYLKTGEEYWSLLPSFWPYVQQQDILFLGQGRWIRPEKYYDLNYPKLCRAGSSPPLILDQDEINSKQKLLQEAGIDAGGWHCTLHVRNSKDGSIRNQDITTYFPAIEYVRSKGGSVFLLGLPSDGPRINQRGLIDLRYNSSLYNELQTFLISQSRFFIGSSGGPIIMPKAFGIPSIMTNIVSLGWCATSGPTHTYYLPKLLSVNGRFMPYSEALRCDPSWGDVPISLIESQNLSLRNNTPEEILDAVSMMVQITSDANKVGEFTNSSITKARSEYEWVASGSIAPTFLDQHPWYAN